MLCVKFPLVQYINLSEIVDVLKSVFIVTDEHLNLSTIFVVSHFLSAKVSPEWKLNQGFGTQKKCPFNRGTKNKPLCKHFCGTKFCVPEWRCPKGEVPLYILT